MVDTAAIRRDLLGSRVSVSKTAVASATGLFLLSLAVAAAAPAVSHPTRTHVLLLLVGCGLVLAVYFASVNSGLLVSWVLVFAPAGGAVTFNWLQTLGNPATIALPFSFGGQGAWGFWLSFSLLGGVIGWCIGVFGGWVWRSVTS